MIRSSHSHVAETQNTRPDPSNSDCPRLASALTAEQEALRGRIRMQISLAVLAKDYVKSLDHLRRILEILPSPALGTLIDENTGARGGTVLSIIAKVKSVQKAMGEFRSDYNFGPVHADPFKLLNELNTFIKSELAGSVSVRRDFPLGKINVISGSLPSKRPASS